MRVSLIKYFVLLIGLFGVGIVAATPPDDAPGNECVLGIANEAFFVGGWILESTRPTRTSGRKNTHEIWQFGADGGFKLTARDPRASDTITSKTSYAVENNTLKIARIGRPGKSYSYELCAEEDNKIILFGGIEGYHFFSKQ